ncbi:hypothetical protein B2J88_07390 [Rhodococcus sp. SRB_17]|uniref:DUF6912 family protein n=1 Tax=unclassified Rhodococcus (in: high G+C Gram-positive bacteria) TaxID=192944 RepID=UPI000B93A210|nr:MULTISPECIES: hypothetical protein [unclassified Rhodococcus (in: high G+C Gram-positive bacteria)]MDI9918918.1 hypothetical protein [Rhodococcus sp. IEGM 1379]NMM84184.1 hypothetical protein [Rhodococcus sp. SRB_17]OYD69194.1 hypothetical protein BDB13_2755 [Rhodococcus sp. OK302]
MRVYVPATVEILQRLVADQEFDPMSRTAFAVTPALREAYAAGDDDELAEVAMGEAARASLRLIAGTEGDVTFRRAVVAADVEDVKLRPDLDDAVVRLAGPVTMAQVASVHVDLAQAEPDIERAAGIVDAADLGDADAEFTLGDAEDHELAWYAVQELPFLLDLL